jgi:hypothetical protein
MHLIKMMFAIMLFASCNSNNDSSNTNEDSSISSSNESPVVKDENKPVKNHAINVEGCYIKILKRDTMLLHVQQNGMNISGKMNFDNYEKDASSGEVKGVLEGDEIKLWYNFHSEGMRSVMELYFKIENNSLIRGIGSVGNKGDTAFFTDHAAIEYPADQSFDKIDCSKVADKYL